ncbi:MAG: PEP-CTERM sorting domain-containing protein [Burkholderiales bacterium]
MHKTVEARYNVGVGSFRSPFNTKRLTTMKLRVLALALGMAAVAAPALAAGSSMAVSSSHGAFVVGSMAANESVNENSFAKRSDSASRQGPAFSPDRSSHRSAVAAVPEPETYALLAAGLCVVVMLSRRRRRD